MSPKNVDEEGLLVIAHNIRRSLRRAAIAGLIISGYLVFGSHANPMFFRRGGYLLFLALVFMPPGWFAKLRKRWWGATYATVELAIFVMSMVRGSFSPPYGFTSGILLGFGLPVFTIAWIHANLVLSHYEEKGKLTILAKTPSARESRRWWGFYIEDLIERVKTITHKAFSKLLANKK